MLNIREGRLVSCPMSDTPRQSPDSEPPPPQATTAAILAALKSNATATAILGALLLVLAAFYFIPKPFMLGSQSAGQWIAASWNEENDQVHCWAIIPIFFVLLHLKREQLWAAAKAPSNEGLAWAAAGLVAYVLSVRMLQPRLAIVALPLMVYGSAVFLWGRQVGRLLIFPCLFLLFMMPLGNVVQNTAGLQAKTATAIRVMSTLCGIPIDVDGAMIRSPEGRFEPMEVAGGCSGIRSLMAMLMLSALYAEFTMRTAARKFLLFGCAIVFAILGNFARVFSVVIFARFLDPKTATGLYHDWSGFVFFPVAVMAMVGTGNLLEKDWGGIFSRRTSGPGEPPAAKSAEPEAPKKGPISYDY
jgi:exosortase